MTVAGRDNGFSREEPRVAPRACRSSIPICVKVHEHESRSISPRHPGLGGLEPEFHQFLVDTWRAQKPHPFRGHGVHVQY